MAHPEIIPIPKDVWTKVATEVQIGNVQIRDSSPDVYYHDFRTPAEGVPTDLSTARRFDKSGIEEIQTSFPIDVYVYAASADGSVLVIL